MFLNPCFFNPYRRRKGIGEREPSFIFLFLHFRSKEMDFDRFLIFGRIEKFLRAEKIRIWISYPVVLERRWRRRAAFNFNFKGWGGNIKYSPSFLLIPGRELLFLGQFSRLSAISVLKGNVACICIPLLKTALSVDK